MSSTKSSKFMILIVFLITAACTAQPVETPLSPTDAPTVQPSPAPAYLPPIPQAVFSSQPGAEADTPPTAIEYGSGGKVEGITNEELEDITYSQILAMYKMVNGVEGQEVMFVDRATYHAKMDEFLKSHPEFVQVTQQDPESDRVLSYFYTVDKSTGVKSVFYDFTPDGALAFTSPMWNGSLSTHRMPVAFPAGTDPFFAFNDTETDEGFWYGIALDRTTHAPKQWFTTFGATVDNQAQQWKEWVVEKKYTSCADPELMAEVKDNFFAETGMSVEDFMAELIRKGKYDKTDGYVSGENGFTMSEVMFAGSGSVSLEHFQGAKKGDKVFCLYVSEDSDPSKLIPIIFSYTYKGNYYKMLGFWEKTGSDYEMYNDFENMTDLENWWNIDPRKPLLGDVLKFQYSPLKNIDTSIEVAGVGMSTFAYGFEAAQLLELMNNGYLQRVAGNSNILESAANLDPIKGDIGLMGYSLEIEN